MTQSQYDQNRDPSAPPVPMNPVARAVRFLNTRFPKGYAAISLGPRLLAAWWWMLKLEREGAGRRLSKLDFSSRRTGDRVFVLGTGASINEYSDSWWGLIRNSDSVSMNFFLLHEHIPTFHVMEDVRGIRARLLEQRYEMSGDYRDVALVMKTQLTNLSYKRVKSRFDELKALPASVRQNIYLSLDVLAAGATVEDMRAAYGTLARFGLWEPKDHFVALTKRRGSVAYAINFAVRAGYREIVLCGVDLNHTEYFYDSRRADIERRGLTVPINDQVGAVHSTNDPERHPVTIRDVILGIKEVILDPRGIDLMLASDTSALYPDLPLFDWDGAMAEMNDPTSGPPSA